MSEAQFRAPDSNVELVRKGLAAKLGWATLAMVPGSCFLGIGLEALSRMLLGNGNGFAILLAFSSPIWLAIAALWANYAERPYAKSARIEGSTLVVGEGEQEQRFERGSFRSGYVVSDLMHGLCLERSDGNVLQVPVPAGQSSEQWLEALGLGTQQKRLDVSLRRWFSSLLYGLLIAPYVVFGTGWLAVYAARLAGFPNGEMLSILATMLLGPLVAYVLGSRGTGTHLTIGADGVLVRRRFRSTFLPYSALRSVDFDGRNFVFTRSDDTKFSVWGESDTGMTPHTVLQRIRDAMHTASLDAGASARAEALARNGRSLADWRKALETVLSATTDYRTAPLDRSALLAVVKDSAAPIEQRIAAAIALTSSGDESAKEQVRVAAEASASEPVRVALSQAVDGQLEESSYEQAVNEERVRVQK